MSTYNTLFCASSWPKNLLWHFVPRRRAVRDTASRYSRNAVLLLVKRPLAIWTFLWLTTNHTNHSN